MAPEFYINESCKGTCRIYTSVTFLFDICGALKWETSHSFKELLDQANSLCEQVRNQEIKSLAPFVDYK